MRPVNRKNILRSSLTAFLIFTLLNAAHSSLYNSGKTKKRSNSKSSLSFNLSKHTMIFSIDNGFYNKGCLKTFKNVKSGIHINLHSIYYQKGNNLYVLPYKQQSFLHNKFKTPQRPY
jgi:hypothetical protein